MYNSKQNSSYFIYETIEQSVIPTGQKGGIVIEVSISIVSLIIAVLGLVFSLVTFLDCKKQQRKQATIDAFNKLQAEALDELNTYTTKNIAEISQNPLSPEYKSLSSLLARCDHFSVGVNEKIYDEEVLSKLAAQYFFYLYQKLEPLIRKKRCLGHKDSYYKEFETLAKRISTRSKEQS